jgi:hypothetical protein
MPHPSAPVRRLGFPLDHPYLEQVWTPIIGPSSVLLLRRCAWLWRDAMPAQVRTEELAAQLGLGKGTGRSSPIWHTVERVVRFGFAATPEPAEIQIYTEVPPVRRLERLPRWSLEQHERLLGQHLDELARSARSAQHESLEAPSSRMNRHLDQLPADSRTPRALHR